MQNLLLALDLGAEDFAQVVAAAVQHQRQARHLAEHAELRHLTLDRPFPFGATQPRIARGLHRLHAGVAVRAPPHPQAEARLVQPKIRRVEVGRDVVVPGRAALVPDPGLDGTV